MKAACERCGADPERINQAFYERTRKRLELVGVVDSKGLHRSEEGDWEAYEVAVYRCPGCQRFFKYTKSQDWEPVGISEFETLRLISPERARELLEE